MKKQIKLKKRPTKGTVTVRLDHALLEEIKSVAKGNKVSVTRVIEHALNTIYMDGNK